MIEDKRMVLEALELRAQYHYDPERDDILNISCAIPYLEDEIVFGTSPKW